MPAARRTKAQLETDNARLTAEVTALREFVFDIDLGRENANLEAQRAALEKFLQEHRAPEPYIALKQIDAGGYHPVAIWRLAWRAAPRL